MRTWERKGYTVQEKDFNQDLHEFDIVQNDKVIYTITPADLENQSQIIVDLNNGEDVDGWEDGNGNTISI